MANIFSTISNMRKIDREIAFSDDAWHNGDKNTEGKKKNIWRQLFATFVYRYTRSRRTYRCNTNIKCVWCTLCYSPWTTDLLRYNLIPKYQCRQDPALLSGVRLRFERTHSWVIVVVTVTPVCQCSITCERPPVLPSDH